MEDKTRSFNADLTDIKVEMVYLNKNWSKTGRNLLYLARRFKKEKGQKYS